MAMNNEFTFEIVEKIAVLSESKNGWKTELNLVNWNDRGAKYDIRKWSPEGKASKGITLSDGETRALKKALAGMEI